MKSQWNMYLLYQSERALIYDGRVSVGHGTHHGDPSCQGSCCARGKVLLVGGSRFTQVDMDINKP